jgi:VCBS repeat-containing protein
MAHRALPNLGVVGDYGLGEQGWDSGVNSNWRALDDLLQLAVIDHALTTPPSSPADGDRYLVPTSAIGAWATHHNEIARWDATGGTWVYYQPRNGWQLYSIAADGFFRYAAGAWAQLATMTTAGLLAFLQAQGYNRPPVSHNSSAGGVDTDVEYTGNLIASDYDPDGDTFYIQSLVYNGAPYALDAGFNCAYGTMIVHPDGSWTYGLGAAARALRAGAVVHELFTYTLADGKGGLSSSVLTITISGTDSAPVVESVNNSAPLNTTITGNVLYYYAYAWEPVALSVVSFTIAGVAGTQTPSSTPVSIPGVGSITLQADGAYTFVPDADWFGPVPLISYEVAYSGGPQTAGYLTLAINNLINTGNPVVLYTDFVSGPPSGGDGDLGAYLSIFGKNFGDGTGLGTTTKVYIGGAEVAAYVLQDNAVTYSKFGVQRIVVRTGTLGGAALGVPIPIVVKVGSIESNADHQWTPNPGRVLYVSLTGNDTTAAPNDITRPWRHLQLPDRFSGGIYPILLPGDQVVIRGGDWADLGYDTAWFRFRDPQQEGSQPTGASGTGWINFTSYPGETVHYTTPSGCKGGFQGAGEVYAGTTGDFWAVANMHIEVSGGATRDAGPINIQSSEGHVRVVNMELGPWVAGNSTILNAAGITGAGDRVFIFGNKIHDIEGTSDLQNHGIYAGTMALGWEIAYNWLFNCVGGSHIQFNDSDGLMGIAVTPEGVWPGFTQVRIHHNWLEVAAKYGINFADVGPTGAGTMDVACWNNVIIGTGLPPLRMNTNAPQGTALFAYHTIYDCNRSSSLGLSMVRNEGDQSSPNHSVMVYNNIFAFGPNTLAGTQWYADNSGKGTGFTFKRNLYYANGQSPASPSTIGDSLAIVADPKFTNAAGGDFTLQSTSPAINAGTQPLPAGYPVFDDWTALSSRELGGAPDVGALEYPDPTPYAVVPPSTSGGPQVGVTTTVSTGSWGNSPTSVTVQWSVGGADVPGATGTTYTPTASDVRQTLRVRVTATNGAGSTVLTLTVGAIALGAGGPVCSGAPVASGTASVGSTLSVTDGTWSATSGTISGYAYQWRRGGANIVGATSNTYTLVSADGGDVIDCQVFALDSTTGSGVATSNSIGPVSAAPADPQVVQSVGKAMAASTSDSVTLTGVTSGNWLLVMVCNPLDGGSGSISAMTDNRGNNLYTIANTFYVDPTRMRYAQIRDAGGGDYTVSVTTVTATQVFIVELSGCDLAAFLDIPEATLNGDRFSTTQTFSIGTGTRASDLAIVMACSNGDTSTTLTPPAGWTTLQEALAGRIYPASVWSQKQSAIAAITCNFSWGGYSSPPYPGPDALALVVRGS